MRKRLIPAVVLALVAAFAWSCGEEDEEFPLVDDDIATFEDFDLNADGFVSPTEWADVDDVWDVDGDHLLDDEEFLMHDDDFQAFDVDDDDIVSGAEWASAFDNADFDADGFLSADELF